MKKRIIFRLVDLAADGVLLVLLCYMQHLIMVDSGFDVPERATAYIQAMPIELVSYSLFALLTCWCLSLLIRHLVELVRLGLQIRQYKRMGIPGPDPNNPCNNCPYEQVCRECPYNPDTPGGYGRV